MFWSSFYDRLQPILWCFERLRMMFFISTKWKLSFQCVKASQTISNRFLPLGRTDESETLHRKTQTIRMLCNIWRVFEKTNRFQYDENTFLISKIFVRFLQIFVLIFVPLCLRVSLNSIPHAEWTEYAEENIKTPFTPKLCVSKSKEIFGAFVFFIYLCPILILSTLQGCFHQSGVRRPKLEQKPTWEGGDDIDV